MSEPRRYVFTGGGTGGHVMPNLAIIRELREVEEDCELLYMGTPQGPEKKLVEKEGVPFCALNSHPLASPRRPWKFLCFIMSVSLGVIKGLIIMLKRRPHVVIATGGYASAPAVLAAAILRRPIYLQEQNVKPGKANLLLSRFASQIGVAFEESLVYFPSAKTHVTGYPVRKTISNRDGVSAREKLQIEDKQRVVFVLGGSMGSRSINRGTVEGISHLLNDEGVTIIHSTGLTESDDYNAWKDTKDRLKNSELSEAARSRYILRRYFDDIEDAYAACDLVVTRAGAGVVMELATLGKPALLIPKSDGADNHQLVNALSLKDQGSAEVLFEEMYEESGSTITRVHGDQLARKIHELLHDEERLSSLSHSVRDLIVPAAGANNVKLVRDLARGKRRKKPNSVDMLIGSLKRDDGQVEEIIFPLSTIAASSTADLRLQTLENRSRAFLRRSGSTPDETQFELIRRRGRVCVAGEEIQGAQVLSAGQQIQIGDENFQFNTAIEARHIPAEEPRLLSKVIVTGTGTLLSRFFGLLRQIVLALLFGASAVTDIVVAGLTASNLFRRIFAENAVDSAFLPTFVMLYRGGRRKEAFRLFRTVLTVSTLITTAIVVVAALSIGVWLPWLVPGFVDKGLIEDAKTLTVWMLPYLTLITIAAVLSAVLKAFNRFAAPAYSSIMFSLGLILGFLLYDSMGYPGIGIGLLLGGLGQIAFQLPTLLSPSFRRRSGIEFRPCFATAEAGMRKVRAAAPKIVADVTISKVATVVDVLLVSMLATGSVAVLHFALVIFQLPFALISQSINTVVLKEFSERIAARNRLACRRLATTGINWNIFLLLPISVALAILSRPIVDLLLSYRSFSADDAQRVALALSCYSIGLLGWGIHGLMGRFYAARLEIGLAVLSNCGAVILNVVLSLIFIQMGMGVAGVALGTSLAFIANALFRLFHMQSRLKLDGSAFEFTDILPSFGKASCATLGAALTCFLSLRVLSGIASTDPESLGFITLFVSRLLVVTVPLATGALTYAGLAWILGSPEMDEILARFRRAEPKQGKPKGSTPPLNVYCLRPEELLRVAQNKPETVRHHNLTRRVREFLKRTEWKKKNIGVKLAGILKIRPLKFELAKIVTNREPAPLVHRLLGGDFQNPGFVRRNAINALIQIESFDADVERAILAALADPYFEVRAAAARAVSTFARELTPEGRVSALNKLLRLVRERNFEVATQAVLGLQAAALDASIMPVLEGLHFHRNWQVRNAVAKAYHNLYLRGVVEDRERIRNCLDDILVTCDTFKPTFELKETLRNIRAGLTPRENNVDVPPLVKLENES